MFGTHVPPESVPSRELLLTLSEGTLHHQRVVGGVDDGYLVVLPLVLRCLQDDQVVLRVLGRVLGLGGCTGRWSVTILRKVLNKKLYV